MQSAKAALLQVLWLDVEEKVWRFDLLLGQKALVVVIQLDLGPLEKGGCRGTFQRATTGTL